MQPFYRSGKSMNTNTMYKQRKLELFSGTPNATSTVWRPKAETEAMFPAAPQGVVSSAGTVGNPAGMVEMEKARAVQGRNHHGVGPTETVRVGPGLGVGPEVQATGGFHPFYRVMPKNINEYRRNNLEGGVNHGASRVGKRTLESAHDKRADKVLWTLHDRPSQRSRAAVLARTADAPAPRVHVKKTVNGTGRFGIVSGVPGRAGGKRGCGAAREPTRVRDYHPDPRNAAAARAGLGGYTVPGKTVVLPSQREQSLSAFPGPVTGQITAGVVRTTQAPCPTIRELQEKNTYRGPVTGPRAERMDVIQKHPMKSGKRASQHAAYTNGAGRMNIFAPETGGKARKRPEKLYTTVGRTQARPIVERAAATIGRRERAGPKRTVVNDRLDLNLARDQLRDNELNHPMAGR